MKEIPSKPFGIEPYRRQSGPEIRQPDGTMFRPRAFMHPCAVPECEKEGSFGFKVRLTAKNKPVLGTWYCFEHRHLGEVLYETTATPGPTSE
jgi:hypothetical protein